MIRNIGICAHIDHGKTTLSDNLLGGSGMISMDLAGKQLFMDFDEEEQARGITINAANVSMVHEVGGQEYLINLIDTPGHVDFGGDVTRAMRAVDGAVVVVDAVEGTMPQTETVLRQALKENVKPILFINKVDRLINELKIEKKDMPIRLGKVIDHVNKLIKGMSPEHYEQDGWKLDASKGTVCFGSALYKWAISVPASKYTGVGFNEVYDYCKEGNMKALAEKSPLHAVLLDTVVHHLPDPLEAQKRRIPVIWRGDKESKVGKDLMTANPNEEVVFMVTKILTDPHAGEVAVGRLFAGTLERGQELYISGTSVQNRVQSVAISMGADRVEVEKIPAGNIAAVTGLRDAIVRIHRLNSQGNDAFRGYQARLGTGHDRGRRSQEHEGPAEAGRSLETGRKGRPDRQGRDQRRDRRAPDIGHGRTPPGDRHQVQDHQGPRASRS